QCNTGSASCCNSTQTAQQAQASGLLAKLGLSVGQITGLIGVDCTPITVIGTEGTCKATQEAVCCTDNGFQAGINLGCSPAT
ncbi:hydrophobin, partial [Leucogyrophana mollusca]